MSWETLPAFKKTTGKPLVSAQLRSDKAGAVRLVLFLSPFVADPLGPPDAVEVQVGREALAGQLRITAGETHKLSSSAHGQRRLTLPWFDGLPQRAAETQPVAILSQGDGALVLRLPVVEWEVEISRRGVVPAPVVRVPAPPPIDPAQQAVKIDMVEFLRPKGMKVSRLGGGWFMLDGERVHAREVLIEVNKFRKRGKAPELDIEGVF